MSLAELSREEHDEACCVYAALILQDAGAEITADKISELVSASGNEVEAYWPSLFAGLLSKVDVNELIMNSTKVGGGGGGAGGAGGAAAGGEEAAEEEKEEEEEEEVDVGGGGLFGGDDEGGY
ncbi:60S acidic ribosomal protein P1 [Hondaea fermentalgiana]|uniref:60S acidic ribosomal protein P1 n=1 Tax=Hondaea fermentalgiana TaxID=2315210 RepID=A0A2R5GBZ4_9STRA|nr:60S acidic ribosomal protein P1 [Hondaea fermentalgiana]|eukprot:GBG28507.1 60S acidic ribosomal protein P1 [Hondaea fermentalgiana]